MKAVLLACSAILLGACSRMPNSSDAPPKVQADAVNTLVTSFHASSETRRLIMILSPT